MNTGQTQADIYAAIQGVEHPAIASSLIDLGMIRDVEFVSKENTVSLTLVLPVVNIPQNVLNYMVNSLYQAIKDAGSELTKVQIAQMTEDERQKFYLMEQQNWRGS
jgi:metal-sulfur cluster biosynthetic enzyme